MYLFQAALQWLGASAVKGAFATERGGKKRQLHLQGFALVHAQCNGVGIDLVKNSLKSNLPVPRGCGYRTDVKPFEGGQTATWMLGYIMKDNSEPWWNMGMLGYSEADCRAGLSLHSTYHLGRFEDGKALIIKREWLRTAYAFYANYLTPLNVSIVQILRFMLLSGRFLPALGWITPTGDKPISLPRAQIHYKWATQAFYATIEEVLLYFFGDGTGVEVTRNAEQHRRDAGYYELQESPNCVCVPNSYFTAASGWQHDNNYDAMSFAQAKAEATRHRDGLDTQAQRDLALAESSDYYDNRPVGEPTIVGRNGSFLMGQDNDPSNYMNQQHFPADVADPVANYRNWCVVEKSRIKRKSSGTLITAATAAPMPTRATSRAPLATLVPLTQLKIISNGKRVSKQLVPRNHGVRNTAPSHVHQ
jgi:hypothetical protein